MVIVRVRYEDNMAAHYKHIVHWSVINARFNDLTFFVVVHHQTEIG